ncbi:MAG: M1 family aminopeptidase [Planctomycetota bacterium]
MTHRPTPVSLTPMPLLAGVLIAGPLALACAAGNGAHNATGRAATGEITCELVKTEAAALMDTGPDRSLVFDPETGRDLRNYPPSPVVDFEHMRVNLRIDDMEIPEALATQTLQFTGIAESTSELSLDARLLEIHSVESAGRRVDFEHDGHELELTFIPPIARDETVEIETIYTILDPPYGLFWTTSSPAWPGRAPQIHTQGQPETNSYWFPCHDFPNDRLTTEFLVTVPGGYEVSSNGRLVGRTRAPVAAMTDGPAFYETFHWAQDDESSRTGNGDHPPYLVTLVVGQFDIVDVATGDVAMPVYVPPGRGPDVMRTYGNTEPMLHLYERLFDEPYPWARYAQLVVHNFGAGGMENTAASTMYDMAIHDEVARLDHDLDGLIAHELAHQWFGDLITCNSWEHIWLNEGFATYLESLWFEHRDGPDGYQADVLANFDSVISRDKPNAPVAQAMASKAYSHPWEVFRRAASPYPKGASVLHMLRRKLGDDTFFGALQLYVDRFKNRTVETDDLRKTLEEVSGLSLERFFDQWIERPGVPTIGMAVEHDTAAGVIRISAEQIQNIDADNPAFEVILPIIAIAQADDPTDRWGVATLRFDTRTASIELPADTMPAMILVDPDMHTLTALEITKDKDLWLTQLRAGPTLASRARAARALGHLDLEKSDADTLLATIQNELEHSVIREDAATALAEAGQRSHLLRAANAQVNDAYVRLSIADGLGTLAEGAGDSSTEAQILRRMLASDPAARVKAASAGALVKVAGDEALGTLLDALQLDSQDDRVRQGVLEALTEIASPEALEAAIALTEPGNYGRTRRRALQTVAALGSVDDTRALTVLGALLSESQLHVRTSIAEAIANLEDPRAIPLLEEAIARTRSKSDLQRLRRALDRINALEEESGDGTAPASGGS